MVKPNRQRGRANKSKKGSNLKSVALSLIILIVAAVLIFVFKSEITQKAIEKSLIEDDEMQYGKSGQIEKKKGGEYRRKVEKEKPQEYGVADRKYLENLLNSNEY